MVEYRAFSQNNTMIVFEILNRMIPGQLEPSQLDPEGCGAVL
jgi:hypothetical protein